MEHNGYPSDWPRCVRCDLPALDAHLTCGSVECDESGARYREQRDWLINLHDRET